MVDQDLLVVVTDANGNTKTLDSDAPDPGDRPQGIQFSTQQASGFYTAGFTLTCPIDHERDDIHLLDAVQILLADGDIVYEGFVAGMPRSTSEQGPDIITVNCAGWMASSTDETFTAIFVDRDLSQWGSTSRTQQIANITAGYANNDSSATRDQSGAAATKTAFSGAWTTGGFPVSDALYDAGPGNGIGVIFGDWVRGANIDGSDIYWTWIVKLLTSDHIASGQDTTADLRGTSLTSPYDLTATAERRFAMLSLYYSAIGGTDGMEYGIDWINTTVVGDHGITLTGAPALGITASDVIRYLVTRYCPLLNAGGVQDATYPILHLVFREDTKPYDAFLKVNSYLVWQLAVWENRTLHFGPADLRDHDWEIRPGEYGQVAGLQGDEYTDLRNIIRVQYTNLQTGSTEVVSGEDYPELRDESPSNPLNGHGRRRFGDTFVIPYPVRTEDAVELGRIRLIEDNLPKAPGTFTARRIRDRAGVEQPVSKVRAGDTISIMSSVDLSSRPRLIGETSYSHDGGSVTISVDGTARVVDAYLDRTSTALQAAGLG